MKLKKLVLLIMLLTTVCGIAQTSLKRVYDERLNPGEQIEQALAQAGNDGRFVIAQVGGNWCKWCLRFAAFIESDPEIKEFIENNYIYLHVNYNPNEKDADRKIDADALMRRLGNPGRFGYPVLVVLDHDGKVLHIQDSSFLESGEGYDKEKVMRFLTKWTPKALDMVNK